MKKDECDILIEYCDKCAEKNDWYHSAKENKIKSSCKLCGRIGIVNLTEQRNIVDFNGFNEETWEGGGFTVDQLIPFPIGQIRETVHPTLSYRILTEKCSLYFDKDLVILTNGRTGQQIRIRI